MKVRTTKIAMLLSVAAMLLMLLAAPVAMADSTRVCNNRCGDIDQSTTTDNSVDNSVDNSGQTIDNSVDNSVDNSGQDNSVDNSVDNSGQTIDNSVDNSTVNKTCGNLSQGSTCNIN